MLQGFGLHSIIVFKKGETVLKYHLQLKIIRIQNGLTQQQLADALGITRSAYCGYEIGRRSPDLDTIVKLSEFYNLPLAVFFENSDAGMVSDVAEFDENEFDIYLSKLTKEERALIARVRSMDDKDKKEIFDLAESKIETK